ncbi:RdgB/HAM1 family non-canonical purine NTP pyrophosphatase [Pelagibacteraceae bacterium]|nr:RdgB/HAM1 family non-canonical purine NTP pyrophosphatase [Pelagibacteraceae bacterium]
MKKILFFSNNLNKVKEVKKNLEKFDILVLSPKDFNIKEEPEEKGSSFADNAKIKSKYGFNEIRLPCIADDSGICIDALKGAPNINSKRFIDSFKSKNECFNYIIKKVRETKLDKAYFQTTICYTIKKNYHIVFEGKVRGRVSTKILGTRGFGYDPIFIPNGNSKTFGEMKIEEKNLFSHRSIAINKFINFLFN